MLKLKPPAFWSGLSAAVPITVCWPMELRVALGGLWFEMKLLARDGVKRRGRGTG